MGHIGGGGGERKRQATASGEGIRPEGIRSEALCGHQPEGEGRWWLREGASG